MASLSGGGVAQYVVDGEDVDKAGFLKNCALCAGALSWCELSMLLGLIWQDNLASCW